MKVWLDDCREPPKGWVWATDYEACISALRDGCVEALSLDHDLGPQAYEAAGSDYGYAASGEEVYSSVKEKTGYDVVLWLIARYEWCGALPDKVYIHSASPPGRERMYTTLKKFIADKEAVCQVILSGLGEHPSE